MTVARISSSNEQMQQCVPPRFLELWRQALYSKSPAHHAVLLMAPAGRQDNTLWEQGIDNGALQCPSKQDPLQNLQTRVLARTLCLLAVMLQYTPAAVILMWITSL